MSNTIKARISLKIDTAEKWKQSELILLAGELGIESDTRKIKIGDGSSKFSQLQYANFDEATLDSYLSKAVYDTNNDGSVDKADKVKSGNSFIGVNDEDTSGLWTSNKTKGELDKKADKSVIGELSNLQTTAKDTLVESVNEIKVSVDAKADKSDLSNYVPTSQKGTNNGVATLDSSGKVPTSQLPSFVDDVIEAENKGALPPAGEEGKIYVTKDDNKTYRWSGSSYVEISASLALGETTGTAYEGNKGKANADAIEALKGRVEAVETTTQDLGALAKKNTVSTTDIDDNSVTNEKIVSVDVSKLTQGNEEFVISCGDSTVA